jgi:hypothetical protein
MALLFIVIPRSCSSSVESMYRTRPTSFWEMIPLDEMRQSERL